jgi:(2R)-ethylmalonyl-CoA mutase
MDKLAEYGADTRISVVVGGIIPPDDFDRLFGLGVKRVFTPSDYELIDIMESITEVIEVNQEAP